MNTTCLVLAWLILSGCAASRHQTPALDARRLDADVQRLMAREKVQGLAVAVIDGGKVVHVAAYGHRNVARGLPLTRDTLMYGASLTKAAFAYLLLQLVDEGRLDLDASVAAVLPRPLPEYADYADLAGDDRWRALTPRVLLTHASGFANVRWLEPDKRLRIHFQPGSRYAYSGEGFYILQLILEQGLRLDVGKEMQARVFDRVGMANTSMIWRPDFAANLADGYGLVAMFGAAREADEGTAAHLFQLLLLAELPLVAYFAVNWLPKDPPAALAILTAQAIAGLAALAPVAYVNL